MNDKPIRQQTFLQGTAVLAMATVLVKLMGFLFKVPLNNIIGDTGFGYFNTAYDVYNVLLMISTTGLPVAMSRMISEAKTLGNFAQIRRISSLPSAIVWAKSRAIFDVSRKMRYDRYDIEL